MRQFSFMFAASIMLLCLASIGQFSLVHNNEADIESTEKLAQGQQRPGRAHRGSGRLHILANAQPNIVFNMDS